MKPPSRAAPTIRTTVVVARIMLAGIMRMAAEAQGGALAIQGLIDRVAGRFVPAASDVAIPAVGGWLLAGPDPTPGVIAGVSVVIIDGPAPWD